MIKRGLNIYLALLFLLSFLPFTIQEMSAASTAVVDTGEYYIKNVQSKSYVDIKNQTMANGTIIHQWKYHGHWTQRWKIELQNNGYHTISSVVSGTKYYLAVQNGSSADGTAIVLKSGAVTSDMLWAISETPLGYYKIAPKVGESINRIMAVTYNSNQSTNGLQIKELTYSNDGHRSDEWILLPALKEISTKNYYDSGFAVRHTSSQAQYVIETSQNKSAERFLSIFGVYQSPTYGTATSTIDSCKTATYGSITTSNLNTVYCNHNPKCYTYTSILTSFTNQKGVGTVSTPRVLWTGHMVEGNGNSAYAPELKAIIITPSCSRNLTGENLYDQLATELHHELSHNLSAPDHYCQLPLGLECNNQYCDICIYGRTTVRTCIMGIDGMVLDDYSDSTLYCTECLIRIRNFLRTNVS